MPLLRSWLPVAQHLRRRRCRPEYLRLARCRHPQHHRLYPGLSRRSVDQARTELPLDQDILNAANAVIDNNESRPRKTLWTENPSGNKVIHYQAQTEHDEADYIAGAIYNRHEISHEPYGDMAILIRTNAQSRVLEEKLMRYAIPYTMVGGTKFYDRKEIKDVLAYLRLLYNPEDSLSLTRIINVPKRNIGATTMEKVAAYAEGGDLPL